MANSQRLTKGKKKCNVVPIRIRKINLRSSSVNEEKIAAKALPQEAGKLEEKQPNKRIKYMIDCSEINMNFADFKDHLISRIKVGGQINDAGRNIRIKEKDKIVMIKSPVYVAKKHIRFVTNIFLRKTEKRKVRIVSNSKKSYKLFFK